MIHLNHNQKLLLFVIILISPLILINEFTYFQENNKLKTNSLKTHGKIFEIGVPTGRGGRSSKYSFFINGKKYTSEIRSNSYCQNISKIVIDSIYYFNFPVVYLPNDPTRSRILLKIEDYQKYNVPIPDTLAEVLVHYFNCDYEVVRQPGKPAKIIKVKHEWFRFSD